MRALLLFALGILGDLALVVAGLVLVACADAHADPPPAGGDRPLTVRLPLTSVPGRPHRPGVRFVLPRSAVELDTSGRMNSFVNAIERSTQRELLR